MSSLIVPKTTQISEFHRMHFRTIWLEVFKPKNSGSEFGESILDQKITDLKIFKISADLHLKVKLSLLYMYAANIKIFKVIKLDSHQKELILTFMNFIRIIYKRSLCFLKMPTLYQH